MGTKGTAMRPQSSRTSMWHLLASDSFAGQLQKSITTGTNRQPCWESPHRNQGVNLCKDRVAHFTSKMMLALGNI